VSSVTSFPHTLDGPNHDPARARWLLNAPTRTKLMLGFGLLLLFLVGAIIAIYVGFTTLRNTFHNLYDQEFALVIDLRTVRSNQNAIRSDLLMILAGEADQLGPLQQDIQQRTDANNALMDNLLALAKDDPEARAKLEELRTLHLAFQETRQNEILPLLTANQPDQARTLILGTQEDRNQQMRSLTEALIAASEERSAAALADADQKANTMLVVLVVIGIVALITGLLLSLLLERIIANPLRAISGVAERVSRGDLTVNVPLLHRSDEVGLLSQMFRRMIDALRELNGEIRDGVVVLTGSTGEIVSATTQLAVGTAETATAVSQTTTTVEEVRQVAEVASQKAKYVLDSAQRSVQVAQTGRRSVEETIQGMQRIQEQMGLIAESIVRLSEQSQAIGEIIASVTDLAEQSNLLAVNAAIEAAKAGEHGRGFGVVAQEMRSLAEQSKQATAQVRTILNDIQKATSSAVMATEQGGRAVEAGVKQSDGTGEAIRVLADVISEAAQAATQIAASSQQQLVGMSQVAQAMENINQAGSQNAASTRQAETIAQDLHKLGQRLKQSIEQYQV
jgi:methyl-accepting chemotaxis protein